MKLSLFNTLTRKREVFNPLDINLIKMYVCGPTVYDHPHIGNARSTVVYDILYRILIKLYGLGNVLYVRNITDIDDKIINRAYRLNIPIPELTRQTITDYNEDMEYLGCLRPTQEPKATDYIPQMIDIIQKLLDMGFAYEANGHVYFNVGRAKNYTELEIFFADRVQLIHTTSENNFCFVQNLLNGAYGYVPKECLIDLYTFLNEIKFNI